MRLFAKKEPDSERPQRSHTLFLVYLALILLSASVALTSGIYAKYVTTYGGTDDTARVAKYDMAITNNVKMTGGFDAPNPYGESGHRTFALAYSGDVAVEYLIRIDTTGNIPCQIKLYEYTDSNYRTKKEGGVSVESIPLNQDYVFVPKVDPGASTRYFGITYTHKATASNIAEENQIDLIEVTVTARQID